MAPRRFEGWEPVQTHTVTAWDAEGRPKVWTTTTQPEWDAEDRAIVQALLDLKADTCGGCGQRLSKSLHKNGEPDLKWVSDFYTCTGCATQANLMDKLGKDDAKDTKPTGWVQPAARKFVVLPKPTSGSELVEDPSGSD